VIRIPITNPKAITLGSVGFMSAWASSGYALDSHHLILAAGAALAGSSVPHNPASSPNVQPESHIVTPYVNNVES
jgi:hypothetical protein